MTAADIASATETNRALGRAFFEEQDRLRGGPAPEHCAPGYQAWIGSYPTMDRAGHEQFAKAFFAGLPDVSHTIEQVVATEDRVVVRFILDGTHTGNFFGIPASGKRVVVAAHVIMHVEDGRVTKLYGIFDEAGLLRQIGVLN
jgi:steroid delta-isomerase-like uncharacterized protein